MNGAIRYLPLQHALTLACVSLELCGAVRGIGVS